MKLKEIKNLLKKYQIRPSKKLGQNFLVDEKVLRKIIESANLSKNDVVLEIGSGIGNLTIELVKRVKEVITVEKDPRMCQILKETLRGFKNIKIIQGDILKISNSQFPNSNYKVVANLPFYLTAPVIRKFLEIAKVKPQEMILVIQKEVAQRICAKPKKMNLLAVSVQFYAKPEILSYIPKKSFWPQPKVDSAIIKITEIRPLSALPRPGLCQLFFKIVKAGFSHPRKQLINNLAEKLEFDKIKVRDWLLRNNIEPSKRAENLKIEDWLKLTQNFID